MQQSNTKLEDHTNEESLKCRRCGRRLKNPESMEIGFGVICYQKYQNRKKLIPLFTLPKQEEQMNERMTKEIALKDNKIKNLEDKVKSLRDDKKIKDAVIAELVNMLPVDVAGDRTTLVKTLTKDAKRRIIRKK